MTTIKDIFHEVQPSGHSLSEARRQVALRGVKFNGQQVTSMMQEAEVKEGSLFQVGKSTWQFDRIWRRLVPMEPNAQYRMKLVDDHDEKHDSLQLRAQMSGADNMLLIGVDGYGEMTAYDGHGFPILVEFHQGELQVMVWGDINNEDPTHVISLEGAREDARKER